MKKYIIFICILFLTFTVKAQLPNQLPQGNPSTAWYQKGTIGGDLGVNWRLSFSDTLVANAYAGGILKNIAGLVIRCVNDYWSRSNDLQQWIKFSTGSASGTVTSVGLTVTTTASPAFSVSNSPITSSGNLALNLLGTSSQLVLGNGALGSSLPSALVPTWQQTLTAGSTLTGNNTITGGGFSFTWNGLSQLALNGASGGSALGYFTNTSGANALTVAGTSTSSTSDVFQVLGGAGAATSLFHVRANGTLFAPLVANTTTQDRLLGQINATGQIGNITLGSGLSLSSGVLNTSGTVATPISSLTAATATNGIDNLNYNQDWAWNTLAGGDALSITSASTAAASNAQRLVVLSLSGANANATQTTTTLTAQNGHSGTASTNIGLYASAINGSNNYAIIVPVNSGLVGIGNSTPVALLTLGTAGTVLGSFSAAGNTSGVITFNPQAAAGTYNWNWPTTAGTSGYFLTSGGGGSTAMTWTDPATLTPSLTSTYIGYGSAGNALTGDANLTYTAASSAVVLDSGYLSFTGNKDFGSSVTGSIFKNSSYGLTFRGVPGSLYDMLFFTQGGTTLFANPTGTTQMGTVSDWGFGLLGSTISAKVHIAAGSTSAGTAPLKFNSGSLMTSAEVGAVEFLTDKWYGTITTGAARKEFTLNDAALTSGRVPYVTTNGRLTDVSTFTFGSGLLSVPQIKGSGSTPSIAGGAGAGSTPTVSITGTDMAGEITVTTDTDPTTSSVFCTVTFATAFGTAPYVVFSPSNDNAALLIRTTDGGLYVNSTTTTFTLNTNSSTPPSVEVEYKFHYHVIQ